MTVLKNSGKGHIYRTYNNNIEDLYSRMNNIHRKIFGNGKSSGKVSSFTKKDEDVLNEFFAAVYEAQTNPGKDNFYTSALKQFLSSESSLKKINNLDFSESGEKFEKSFSNFLNQFYEEKGTSVLGSDIAEVSLGQFNIDINDSNSISKNMIAAEKLEKEFKDMANLEANGMIDEIEKKLRIREIKDQKGIIAYQVVVGARRFGKIDVAGNPNANILITAEQSSKMIQALEIIKNATFSLKSYTSDSSFKLGNTKHYKAITSVLTGLGEKPITYFYFSHGDSYIADKSKNEEDDLVEEFNEHFNHIKEAYELSGYGLKYDDSENITNVDFLIENRTHGGGIKVIAVQSLLDKSGGDVFSQLKTY